MSGHDEHMLVPSRSQQKASRKSYLKNKFKRKSIAETRAYMDMLDEKLKIMKSIYRDKLNEKEKSD